MSVSESDLNSVVNFDKLTQQLDSQVARLQQDYVEQLSLRTSTGKNFKCRLFKYPVFISELHILKCKPYFAGYNKDIFQ